MITSSLFLHFIFSISILLPNSIYALNQDGTTLLSFKQSLLSYPPSVFQNWNHTQATPCSWSGVTCAPQTGSVVSLVLPNSRLVGSIPDDISRLEHLRVLDLSHNSINGTLPVSLSNISNLQTLALSYNFISGGLPGMFNMFHNLRVLNLSHNYLSGRVSGRFDTIEVLDLSYNMFDKNLPLDFGGFSLNYLNLSHNKIPGSLSLEFASKIPERAILDLSFNNFSGQIPQTSLLSNTKPEYFAGNLDLCGKPLAKMCTAPSSHSLPPNVSLEYPSTAAIAANPKTLGKSKGRSAKKVDTGKIVAIVVGDAAAVVLFVVLFFYVYQIRKKKMTQNTKEILPIKIGESTSTYSPVRFRCCFIGGMEEETSETSTEYESVGNNDDNNNNNKCLVMVDGETELEMETLLKASAYILGSSGGSIVYKAVVRSGGGDGAEVAAFAVRRIAKCDGVEKMTEFEKIVRVLGKFRHPNLVKVRGFYWGEEEKLLICDYVTGGSLAAAAAAYYKKASSSSCHLSFEVRLKIAKGIAKGLSYIHEKKHVHGNIKPSNILLTSEMDALISDFGLEWLVSGQKSYITDKSTRNFGTKGATSSVEETLIHRDLQNSNNNNTYVAPSTKCTSPYQAPESMKNLKPNPKWDVYSFGIILLELFSGKMFSTKELAHWNTDLSISNNETKILEIIDGFTTIDVHEQKDCLLTCFKLGFNCASLAPQKRPSMKEALQVLEKIPCPS